MTSLFSPFDIFFFSVGIISILALFFLLVKIHKLGPSQVVAKSFSYLASFFSSLFPGKVSKFTIGITLSMFILIFAFNLLSVFPFIFPFTSSFGTIMFSSISFLFCFMVFSSLLNSSKFLSHFIPEGAPMALVVFLFLIELISTLIRPLTLTVRLVANILAGHLLMILLSKMVLSYPFSMVLYVLLNCAELFVALIQSYIFCTMLFLYYSETY